MTACKIRLCVLLFTMLSIACSSFGQDTISKVIVIDSLILDSRISKERKALIRQDQKLLSRGDDYVFFTNNYWNEDETPALCVTARFAPTNDMSIGILIDDKGSRITLHHLETLGDTLHFGVCKIVLNCLNDSISNFYCRYRHVGDSIIKTYKGKKWTTFSNCGDTLREMILRINGMQYHVPVSPVKAMRTAVYCGPSTKRDERKKWKFFDDRLDGHPRRLKYNSFSSGFTSYGYNYNGELDFSKKH